MSIKITCLHQTNKQTPPHFHALFSSSSHVNTPVVRTAPFDSAFSVCHLTPERPWCHPLPQVLPTVVADPPTNPVLRRIAIYEGRGCVDERLIWMKRDSFQWIFNCDSTYTYSKSPNFNSAYPGIGLEGEWDDDVQRRRLTPSKRLWRVVHERFTPFYEASTYICFLWVSSTDLTSSIQHKKRKKRKLFFFFFLLWRESVVLSKGWKYCLSVHYAHVSVCNEWIAIPQIWMSDSRWLHFVLFAYVCFYMCV